MARILVVDDDPAMRQVLRLRLAKWGHEVTTCADVPAARAAVTRQPPDIVITDLVMPGATGLDLLRELKAVEPAPAVVLITAHGEVEKAVEAMKHGAADFVTKPLDYDHLKTLLDDLEEEARRKSEVAQLRHELAAGEDFGPFVGTSAPMQAVYRLIEEAAATDVPVLVTGASGTGKELVAHTVHRLSRRREGPFLAVNAAAIPSELMESELFGHEKGAFTGALERRAGCFELADGGTLFLDEISEMSPPLQAKLSRVLEDGEVRRIGGRETLRVDVRVVAATNRDPRGAVAEGRLREDLYFRLNVFSIELPTLRERRGDLPRLVQYFLTRFQRQAQHEG